MVRSELIDRNIVKYSGNADQRATQFGRFQHRDEQVTGADLGLAEQERRVVPAAIQRFGDLVGNARHLGLVSFEAVHRGGSVSDQLCATELVVIDAQREIGPILLQQVQHPVTEFDVAVAGALGRPQTLQERLVTETIELAGRPIRC